MGKCICSSCKNLKLIINENGESGEYECEFGFPSEKCVDCNEENCSETCSEYICDELDEEIVSVNCEYCGRELKKIFKENEDKEGRILCIDCFLKENS